MQVHLYDDHHEPDEQHCGRGRDADADEVDGLPHRLVDLLPLRFIDLPAAEEGLDLHPVELPGTDGRLGDSHHHAVPDHEDDGAGDENAPDVLAGVHPRCPREGEGDVEERAADEPQHEGGHTLRDEPFSPRCPEDHHERRDADEDAEGCPSDI